MAAPATSSSTSNTTATPETSVSYRRFGKIRNMTESKREILFLIFQLLENQKYEGTLHRLEQESGLYFNMKYFEDLVSNGNLDEAENYLSGFINFDDNRHSCTTIFEIRKLKYLEALDRQDIAKAHKILLKDLKVFGSINEEVFKQLTLLFSFKNFRENELLSNYGDTKSMRRRFIDISKELIKENPKLHAKLKFPAIKDHRLLKLIIQSLNWQHTRCNPRKREPLFNTLFEDHNCGQSRPMPMNNSMMNTAPGPKARHGALADNLVSYLRFGGKTRTMRGLTMEILFLLFQLLQNEKYEGTLHRLEQESGLYFNTKYFEDLVSNGNLDEAENYISGFINFDDNRHSCKTIFEIRKLKYLEALDRQDIVKAREIFLNDLKVFESFDEELLEQITHQFFLKNFSLNWQHTRCNPPKPEPLFNTLFEDHNCDNSGPCL
ncbi:protein TPR3-like isoform X2 [Amaranthus tricolor]|uniref:protein TPR3-like isoform X2 n=1 Tax=Amaranthus tricolor TaxID=29722 RepID=UPI002585E8E7|nr:protein TPR3-like isoform X2 [Amaranthus tricolor]